MYSKLLKKKLWQNRRFQKKKTQTDLIFVTAYNVFAAESDAAKREEAGDVAEDERAADHLLHEQAGSAGEEEAARRSAHHRVQKMQERCVAYIKICTFLLIIIIR